MERVEGAGSARNVLHNCKIIYLHSKFDYVYLMKQVYTIFILVLCDVSCKETDKYEGEKRVTMT